MATISRAWAAEAIAYQTNLYGGADADVGGTELFTGDIDLETDGYEGMQIEVAYDSSGTTDNLEVRIYGSLDGTHDGDEKAMHTFIFGPNAGAEAYETIILIGADLPAHMRIGLKRSGSTDTFDVQVKHQRFRYQSV